MLEKIADSIRNNKNILEKKEINPIVQHIEKNSFKSNRIHSYIGEDSASVENGEKLILITTDRIITDFVENFPYGAGYSSILVSVDDIYACGGTPLGASIILSFKDQTKGRLILEGICEGSNKFKIPVIRGHTNTHAKCYELSSTAIGEVKRQNYISAGGAKVGDMIILAIDTDGKIGKASKFFFDTTTFKSSKEVLFKREAMNKIAEAHFANSSKDISNGGIFGTTLQLIKYSGVGADININQIKIPQVLLNSDYDLDIFTKMYLTTSFILTAQEKDCNKIIEIFRKHDLQANVVGKIIKEKNLLRISNERKFIDVLKF